MAEFVQRRKEEMLVEVPVLQSHFKPSTVKRIINQREKFEYRLMRRNKKKSDFALYILFLKSIIKKVEKMGTHNSESLKLLNQHKNRIVFIYRAALKYFKSDINLWIEYIKFLIKYKRKVLLRSVVDSALLLHGNNSDELYVFAVKQEYLDLKNIQKARELYTNGLHAHKNSSALYFEAFKIELAYSQILTQKVLKSGKEFSVDDPALNGSIAKVIFESAADKVKDDHNLFFKMLREAKKYNFALNLYDEIKNFMQSTFNKDPNFWNTLATNELLLDETSHSEKIRINKCLLKYDEALSILDTDEMWDKYVTTILTLTSDNDKTEIYKRNLLRQSMFNAHKKNKLKPIHYIQWVNKSKSSMAKEILDWAVQTYPTDVSILEMRIHKLIETDKLDAYELFKQNINSVSPSIWLLMVKHLKNNPQIKDIFDMVFEDNSVCSKEVKQKLENEYLIWLNKNKSLTDVRNAYNKLIVNNSCDASLCKTLVNIEIDQPKIDLAMIRQHFTLACMMFGKTDIELWMHRLNFEVKYGSPRLATNTYYEAVKTLNNEESDKFVIEYGLTAPTFVL